MSKPSSPPGRSVKTAKKIAPSPADVHGGDPFPIVGIGASAGGLLALEQFLKQVPEASGMAFVIVQHLDPSRKGMMAEILQRNTAMKVIEVKDGTKVGPDCVYVIPPNKDMSILHGVLHLLAPPVNHGLRLAVDFFLASLAQDRRENSIGVVLSGMGSDGTEGLRAIREKSGMTLVQDPDTAEYDSMPRSAVDAGLADIVASVDELPSRIVARLRHPLVMELAEPMLEGKTQNLMDKVVILLRANTGNDFSFYKRNTLYRRIERRMGIHQFSKMASYVRYLQENPQELSLLFKELLIGVTSFFRDPESWEQLRTEAVPGLLESLPDHQSFRGWVPGCSTGEEAYSLAIVLKEAVEKLNPRRKITVQIFATDLNPDAIDMARSGFYPASIAADISKERLKRFFSREESGYRVKKDIREMVVFAPQNLIMDPPFTKLDILSCRNLLIYLTAEVQKKLIPLFHYSLNPGGILFQGSAETTGKGTHFFTPLSGKSRIFRRVESLLPPKQIEFPASFSKSSSQAINSSPSNQHPPVSLQALADHLIQKHYAPPAVLTNDKGDIIYISGHTGKFLEPSAGKANWNLFAMAREGLRYEVTEGLQRALRQKERVDVNGLEVVTDDGIRMVNITLQQIDEPGLLHGLVMIVFLEVPQLAAIEMKQGSTKSRIGNAGRAKFENELLKLRGEARTTHEDMQTFQEELRSANEELQSTNEELQSSNEELTTSKEEMQSINEELQAVNTELQIKVDQLSRTSNDMKNLLDSTDIATLFLDKNLHVRRFTPQATKIIKLIPGDAGRPITDLVSDLIDPTLADDSREVLRTQVPAEKTVSARDGRWFTMRIMPYRPSENRSDGLVITFADITVAKTLEEKLRKNQVVPPAGISPPAAAAKRVRKPASV